MKPAGRERLDRLLVDRGLAESREKAQALILAGAVLVNGQKSGKPGQGIPQDSRIELVERLPYVSRGGRKLEAALAEFRVDVSGKTCLDIGSSTGGFTDCLLQRGAARVYSVDVGSGQLDWKLRNDPRVVVREGINARRLRFEDLGECVDLAVCDVSFISVTLILPVIPPLLREGGAIVVLVKPQFEVGRGQVGRGGIVRDPELHQAACRKVEEATEALGFRTKRMQSPILGAEGNKEYLLYASH
jgi:23S rRNA (cytidine1920-2'-O)/16S rRNA (cytidine1409-2'-O)-methyltransferase